MKKRYFIILFLIAVAGRCGAQEFFRVDSIDIEGTKTKPSLLIRELNFQVNDQILQDSLKANFSIAEKRLMNTQLFNHVAIDTETHAGKNTVHIKVKERFPIFPEPNLEFADRNFNVWWTEQNRRLDRLNVGLTLTHKNFRNKREELGIGAQIGYTQKIYLSYAKPFMDKAHKHGLGASFAYLKNKELAYITDANKQRFVRFEQGHALQMYEAAAWYTYRPKFEFTHTVRLGIQHYKISDSIADYYNPHYLGNGSKSATVLSLSYRFDINRVDNWNYPLTGSRFIGIASYLQMINSAGLPIIHLQYDWYRHLFSKWYVSVITRARKAFAETEPYIFQNNLGKDMDFIRGYEYYVQDGSGFALGRANLKYELLNTKINLPIKYFQIIPLRLYPKVFGDAGYGYSVHTGNHFLNNQFLYSYGIGMDIVTLYDIKIRLEYTINKFGKRDLYIHKSGE